MHEEVINLKNISAGVPQDTILGSIFYLFYRADIPTNNDSMISICADEVRAITLWLITRRSQLTISLII